MNLIVDTNLVFSSILNPKSRIGEILISHHKHFNFYSCNYLKVELKKYYPKLALLTKKSLEEIQSVEALVTRNVKFIDEELISRDSILMAYDLVEDVDPNDVFFVSLALTIDGNLWTGNKKLLSGLRKKGFSQVINTEELIKRVEITESDKD